MQKVLLISFTAKAAFFKNIFKLMQTFYLTKQTLA
jgi:hypothetical protein